MNQQTIMPYRAHGVLMLLPVLIFVLLAGCGSDPTLFAAPGAGIATLPPRSAPLPTPTLISVALVLSPTVTSVVTSVATNVATSVAMPGMDMPTIITVAPTTQTTLSTSVAATPAVTTSAVTTPAVTSTEFVIDWVLFGTPTSTPFRADIPAASLQSTDSAVVTASIPTVTMPTVAPASPTAVIAVTALATTSANSSASTTSTGTGDAKRGQALFTGAATCSACHDVASGTTLVGPSLKGIASRAGSRKPGMSASDYIHESIMTPNAFIVPGFSPGIMPQTFAQTLSAPQINDLIAYLLTLK